MGRDFNYPITIKQLKKYCEAEIKAGNGDKMILISQDDEGNGYHSLFYAFTPMNKMLINGKLCGEVKDAFYGKMNENNTIILG